LAAAPVAFPAGLAAQSTRTLNLSFAAETWPFVFQTDPE
jgi:hypothetical protein